MLRVLGRELDYLNNAQRTPLNGSQNRPCLKVQVHVRALHYSFCPRKKNTAADLEVLKSHLLYSVFNGYIA